MGADEGTRQLTRVPGCNVLWLRMMVNLVFLLSHVDRKRLH